MGALEFVNFYLIPGLVLGCIYAISAVGLSLLFGILRFANFAHGDMMTWGAYSALVKGDWRFGVSDTEVRVLDPISTEGMTLDDVAMLRDRVRDQIAATIDDMKLAEAR